MRNIYRYMGLLALLVMVGRSGGGAGPTGVWLVWAGLTVLYVRGCCVARFQEGCEFGPDEY